MTPFSCSNTCKICLFCHLIGRVIHKSDVLYLIFAFLATRIFEYFELKWIAAKKAAVFDLKNITSCPTYKTRKVCKYLNNSNISKITFFDLNIWFLSRLDPKSSKMCHLRAGLSPYRRSKIQNKIFSQRIFQNTIFFCGRNIFSGQKIRIFWVTYFWKKIQFFNIASNWHNEP